MASKEKKTTGKKPTLQERKLHRTGTFPSPRGKENNSSMIVTSSRVVRIEAEKREAPKSTIMTSLTRLYFLHPGQVGVSFQKELQLLAFESTAVEELVVVATVEVPAEKKLAKSLNVR